MESTLTAEEKITKSKIFLNKNSPFFAYLVMHMKFKPMPIIGTMGVDFNSNVPYNPTWVDKLSEEETTAVICHETMHIALLHLIRHGNRDKSLFNVATDLVINSMLQSNNFKLPKGVLIPFDNQYEFEGRKGKFSVRDIDKKTAEEIYDELITHAFKYNISYKGFDQHTYGENGNTTQEQRDAIEKEGGRLITEAYNYAKQQGKVPGGLDRLIEKLLEKQMNWKSLLQKYLINELPYDYTYSRPSKRSISTGFYIPAIKKEMVEIVVAVDTSGSIGQQELTEFLTEIVGIAKSHENVKMTVLTCDCEIIGEYEVSNGNIETIMALNMKGGGGTSHVPIFEYFDDKRKPKLLVCFTDGYTTCPNDSDINTLWVLSSNGIDKEIKFGQVIKIDS